ncbi:FlgD immunoglobulin-like domain containing protein [Candidatus Neomarinimicrobiota bacterium]
MKKMLIVVIALFVSYAIAADVTVTFRANTSTVQGVTDTSDVTPGGAGLTGVDLRGTVQSYGGGTDWTPGANPMMSVGGDYWEYSITFPEASIGTALEYKFGYSVLNLDGTVTSSWEGTPNRPLTVPTVDTVLPVDYVNSETPPFVDVADSLDVFFRVNMSTNTDFDPATQQVHMAGSLEGWSHSIVMNREGTSSYYNYHWRGNAVAEAPVAVEYKFTLGDWSGTHESVDNRVLNVVQDTTIQWVYYNNVMPKPFAASDTLASLTFTTDVSTAITSSGFNQGDTLIVKYGYGGTQAKVTTDTLAAGFGTIYAVTIPNVGVDFASDGLFYQFYRIKNGIEYREIFYNFNYAGSDVSLAERRLDDLSGATALGKVTGNYAAYTINDNQPSNVSPRRMPKFRNANKICGGCGDDNLIQWTYILDLRPAYAQVAAGSVLEDIQGDFDITSVDQIDALGVFMNGPATVDEIQTESWTTWGGQLAQTEYKKMYDDGKTDLDLVAGDSLFSNTYVYKSNSTELGQEFKFGIGGGDNEGGFGNNHIENLNSSISNTTIFSAFGSIDPNFYNAWDYDTNSPNLEVELTGGALPHQFSLGDNYPNPFNPTTTVEFKLPIGANVKLNVYNLLGERIATIYNSYAQPGNYKATWNGLDLNGNQVPSGTYLFELDAGEYFHQVKKMTMIK